MRSRVDFPAPFSPTIPTISPGRTLNVTARSTWRRPNARATSDTLSARAESTTFVVPADAAKSWSMSARCYTQDREPRWRRNLPRTRPTLRARSRQRRAPPDSTCAASPRPLRSSARERPSPSGWTAATTARWSTWRGMPRAPAPRERWSPRRAPSLWSGGTTEATGRASPATPPGTVRRSRAAGSAGPRRARTTNRSLEPAPPRRRRLRSVPALPRCLPHRGNRRALRGRRPPVHLVSDDRASRPHPARTPRCDRRPHLRVRHLPGRLPPQRQDRGPVASGVCCAVGGGRPPIAAPPAEHHRGRVPQPVHRLTGQAGETRRPAPQRRGRAGQPQRSLRGAGAAPRTGRRGGSAGARTRRLGPRPDRDRRGAGGSPPPACARAGYVGAGGDLDGLGGARGAGGVPRVTLSGRRILVTSGPTRAPLD